MKIPIFIERTDFQCGDCPFLDASFLSQRGQCSLFKEGLTPMIKNGGIEGFEPCSQCDRIYRKNKQ
jgi:hypothetical protein